MHHVNGPQVTHGGFFSEPRTVKVLEVFQDLSPVGEEVLVELFIVFGGLCELVQAAELLPQAVHDLLLGLMYK